MRKFQVSRLTATFPTIKEGDMGGYVEIVAAAKASGLLVVEKDYYEEFGEYTEMSLVLSEEPSVCVGYLDDIPDGTSSEAYYQYHERTQMGC